MKFARFPKFALLFAIAGVLTLSLFGCGAAVSNLALTQGNWAVSATSTAAGKTVSGPTFVVGGNLTQSGTSLTGTFYISGSGCIVPQFVSFTGTVKGNNVALTSASFGGQVITVTASGAKDSLSGNYTVTGTCADSGTVSASAVPSISGTWNGTVQVNGVPATISVALTQAATASVDGSFAITGTATYSGSSCQTSATITPSSLQGISVNLNANIDTGTFNFTTTLDSAPAPKNMTGDYFISDGCSDGDQTVTLTKQ